MDRELTTSKHVKYNRHKILFHCFFRVLLCLVLTSSLKSQDLQRQTKQKIEIASASIKKPNIVLLFVDDWGWSDVGYRNSLFETPHINTLKKESLEFTRAYIPTPTCSPSRASLLTGKEAVRLQMVRHISGNPEIEKFSLWPKDPAQMPSINYLPLEEITYAERLKAFGYFNMFIGKWHLGHQRYYPNHQGFDAYYGVTNAGHPKSYYPSYFRASDNPESFMNTLSKNNPYLTDLLTDNAIDFIKNYNQKKPFMLTFWYYNVHGPHVGKKEILNKYLRKGLEGKYAHYAAMVESVDNSVGKIRKALTEKGIAKNTIIILLSDQGGLFSNEPLSGGKKGGNTLGEGGARVPFIFLYPGVTKIATETNIPVQSIDIYPTLIEIASGKKFEDKTIQGRSLMPLLQGKSIATRNLYFYRSYEDQYAAIIQNDWKLVKYRSGLYKLYNLKNDVSEKNNILLLNPQKFQRLKDDLNAWEKDAVHAF